MAAVGSRHVHVRWDRDVPFWRAFLTAALDADEPALVALRHRAKRLFCGDLIRRARY